MTAIDTVKALPWRTALSGLAAAYMTTAVLRSVFAPSMTIPNEADVAKAGREAAPATGVDERFARPEGFVVAGNGVVEPADRETEVASSTAGKIVEVRVHEGDRVNAGDVLVVLENAVETATLAAAEADVAAAQADYDRTRKGSRAEDVDAAVSDAEAAKARAGISADALRRTEELAANGHASAEELERARRQAEADKATAEQSDARRRLSRAGSRSEDIAASEARLAAATARRDEAKARLEQRTIIAPISGEILQVLVRPGEFQQPGGAEPLVVMGDTSTLRVRMDVDERDIGSLKVGDAAVARAIAFAGVDFPAHVAEIGRRMGRKNVRTDDPVERNDTKILEVVLTLDNPGALVVGQRVVCYAGTANAPG